MKNANRGSMLFFLMVVLAIVCFSLVRAGQVMSFNVEKKKGRVIATEVFTIIDAWSKAMDYKCVVGDLTQVDMTAVELSERSQFYLNQFSVKTSAPPTPIIEIEVTNISDITKDYLVDALDKQPVSLSPVVQVVVGANITVIATRGQSAAESVAYSSRRNAETVIISKMISGNSHYGSNGC